MWPGPACFLLSKFGPGLALGLPGRFRALVSDVLLAEVEADIVVEI